uniref:subtilisin n=1 Tax=Grammatophora oceanica TaxID=210454 RepID=A0A7S1YKJ5_9STRA|mmetsp:Transcript_52129/g.77825  ORF Transcript_52129/g.77825 Transcript_52129/m.77825 type:complete len:326 (+) Transcript_52129:62-1039(+)
MPETKKILVKDAHAFIPAFTKGKTSEKLTEDDELPYGCQIMGAAKLHKEGKKGKGVRVAVIDSGVDAEHPAFDGMVKYQAWFRWGTPLEEDDHGTHVAGTIHNMAPEAEIYDYRVFGGEGAFEIDDAIVTSIFEACYDGCDIINMSLGGRWPSANILTAVQYAHSQGVIVVCAAGNSGDDDPLTNERGFPAMWEEAISVAASSKKGKTPVAFFSNTNPHIDYAGIGVDVVSMKPGGSFQEMSGTSMACPHVAGLIAAVLHDAIKGRGFGSAHKPNDTKVRAFLNKKCAIDIGVEGPDNASGIGFLSYLDKGEFDALMEKVEEAAT